MRVRDGLCEAFGVAWTTSAQIPSRAADERALQMRGACVQRTKGNPTFKEHFGSRLQANIVSLSTCFAMLRGSVREFQDALSHLYNIARLLADAVSDHGYA